MIFNPENLRSKLALYRTSEKYFKIELQFGCKIGNDKLIYKRKYSDYESTANSFYKKKHEKTALHFAIEKGFDKIVKLLISNPKVDINMKSKLEAQKDEGCVK